MNNPHLWRKRQLIESGALTTWSRRGGTYAGTHWPWIETALQVGLGVLGLRSRGESNALSPVVNRLHFTLETLSPAYNDRLISTLQTERQRPRYNTRSLGRCRQGD